MVRRVNRSLVVGALVGLLLGCVLWDFTTSRVLWESATFSGSSSRYQLPDTPAHVLVEQEAQQDAHCTTPVVPWATEVKTLPTVAHLTKLARSIQQRILKRWSPGPVDAIFSPDRWEVTDRADVIYRLQRAMVLQDQWVMDFIGTSVTAGHDNYHSQSYPFAFERRVRPLFDALHIPFTVSNFAMGNYVCYPSHLCFKDIIHPHADVVSWEFQMMECGGTASTVFALQMATLLRQPILNMSMRVLRPHKEPAWTYTTGPQQWNAVLHKSFANSTVMSSSFAHLVHNASFGNDPNNKFAFDNLKGIWESPEGKKLLGFAPWHPSPAGHQLLADVDAFYWADLLIEALATLPRDPDALLPHRWPLRRKPMPPLDQHPHFHLLRKAKCYTDWEPRYNGKASSIWNVLHRDQRWKLANQYNKLLWHRSVPAVQKADSLGAGYRDRKIMWENHPCARPDDLVFQWEQREYGPVAVCSFEDYLSSWKNRQKMNVYLDGAGLDLSFEKSPWLNSEHDPRNNQSATWKAKWPALAVITQKDRWWNGCAFPAYNVTPGNHTLTVRVNPLRDEKTKQERWGPLSVSHFIHW